MADSIRLWGPALALLIGSLLCCRSTSAAPPSDSTAFFETRIRPLLVDHCYKCHSHEAEKLKANLHLDSREGILHGGDTGPAIVPGKAPESLLIKAVRYTDPDLQMPPKNQRLSSRQVEDLEQWINAGALWGTNSTPRASSKETKELSSNATNHWAFRAIQAQKFPQVRHTRWPENGIDYFVLARLEAKGLSPNAPADRRVLIRRATLDLIGLPPTPEEVSVFLNDRKMDAYERLLERLLARPEYGERWARHWLDVVRFAQSNGYERDGEKPFAWRYRDYVVNAFNQDKPYDRFVMEQIAGDLLPDADDDSIIATGFQRLGVWDDEPDDKLAAQYDELDDIISATGAAFLGLTLGCARCHDHKFDPISQKDYYQFLAFFRNIHPNAPPAYTLSSPSYAPLGGRAKIAAWKSAREIRIRALEAALKGAGGDEKKKIEQQLKETKEETPPFQWALAVRERDGKPQPTPILIRGNPHNEGAVVEAGFPAVLTSKTPRNSEPPRLELARWMAASENPLTARVMVNRVWKHHFGNGLARITTDFGKAGLPPTHPELLDWLSQQFIQSGWSLKALHKTIMLSRVYQMSSSTENSEAKRKDPGNEWLWRQNLRRLEAEPLRDSILSASGTLNSRMGGRGFFPHLDREVLAGASRPGLDWEKEKPAEETRRTLYMYIRRTMLPPVLETFDYNNTATALGERPITTVGPQALLLLHDTFLEKQAAEFASRLEHETGGDQARIIRRAYEIALNRAPTARESALAERFLSRQNRALKQLTSRLTFRCDVPVSLSVQYFDQLSPADFLKGPSPGWSYYRGEWSPPYEGIRTVNRERVPFGIYEAATFTNGIVRGELTLGPSSESASLLLRGHAVNDLLQGYELQFDLRGQKALLKRHSGVPAQSSATSTLSSAPIKIIPNHPLPFQITLNESALSLQSGKPLQTVLSFTDLVPIPGAAAFGITASGDSANLEHLTILSGDKEWKLGSPELDSTEKSSPAGKSLARFCLLLFNLNEFVYVE